MEIKDFTKPGATHNEDAIYTCEKFAFVIDGATGLLKENISDMPSDAQWFAQSLKNYLIENLSNYSLSIKDIIRNAILEINKKYNHFKGADKITSKPSASIALFRIYNDILEYFILGDCALIIKDYKNKIKHIKINDLTNLDNLNIKKMKSIACKNQIDVIDARNLINNDLLKTRLSQNTEEGYWIISDNLEAVNHALCGTMPVKNIKELIGISDGFSQIYDKFNYYTKKELFEELNNNTIDSIYKTLWNLQEEDKLCNNFPRFKIRDDASIFYIVF